jgi:small subunit ribosomal protein S3
MGHKVHPIGFRIGVIRDWQAKWYADKHYGEFLREDLKLRKGIRDRYSEAAVSLVEIERQANRVSMTIHTARPGIVIGRGGQRVDETRAYLEKLIGKKVQLNIQEIQRPELDAYLVAKNIAEQIERRVAFRRAMKQATLRTMQAGARGVRVNCAGRLGGAEIARRLMMHEGQVPLHTLRADIDYGFIEARTPMGRIGVKVWIYKGDILPELKKETEEVTAEAAPAVEVPVETPVAKIEKKEEAAAPVAEVSAPAEAPAPAEEKPKPAPRRRSKVAAETREAAEPAAEAPAPAEEKPKPAPRRRSKAAAETREAAEPAAEAPAPAEKKPKTVTRRRTKKSPAAEETSGVKPAEEEEDSATA